MEKEINKRLEHLRKQIKNECISYGEIVELQNLVEYIDNNDIELLQWAKIERDCMNCEKTFETTNKENADFCPQCECVHCKAIQQVSPRKCFRHE